MAPPMGDVSGSTAVLVHHAPPSSSLSDGLFVHPSDWRAKIDFALTQAYAPDTVDIAKPEERQEAVVEVDEEGHVYDPNAPIPDDVTDVVLVRHGETYWNHDHRLQGQLDTDLDKAGRAQAQAVGQRFGTGEIPFAAIYTSDLRRAADTAQAIADWTGFPQVVRDTGLRERHIGYLQGCLAHEAMHKQPAAYRAFHSNDPTTPIPGGGESMEQLTVRVTKAVEDIAKKHRGQRVVVVCHGGVMMALHRYAEGRDSKKGVINASINVVRVPASGKWNVLLWGDVKHLSSLEFDADGFGGGKDSA